MRRNASMPPMAKSKSDLASGARKRGLTNSLSSQVQHSSASLQKQHDASDSGGSFDSAGERVQSASDEDNAVVERIGTSTKAFFGRSQTFGDSKGEDFEFLLALSKTQKTPVEEVRRIWEEFKELNVDHSGEITPEEFQAVVRRRCNIPDNESVPAHLRQLPSRRLGGSEGASVGFEEYLMWYLQVAYAEEFMVTDPKERVMRNLSRKHDLCITDVERIKKVFVQFDDDDSGTIDREEFKKAILAILGVKNPSDVSAKKLERYWNEADSDRNGTIDFEEFLLWHSRNFDF